MVLNGKTVTIVKHTYTKNEESAKGKGLKIEFMMWIFF